MKTRVASETAPDQLRDKGRRYKRPLDLNILVLAHLFLLPMWILLWVSISICIWLEDHGPIFYIQQRVGRGGSTFGLIKFRSMRVKRDGESWSGQTAEDDPRITRVGRFLRSTALDELPQVINLWKGDISFVGPRALPGHMHEDYLKEEPRFVLRLQVRPGLSGLAQIYLARHCSARKRLRYDLLYIRIASPWLDLKLIITSLWLTLTGRWGKGPRESEEAPSMIRSQGGSITA
jgi:lipopolysaccharide/colanic/teichoic acid biosynthesis glycosyltransferase